MNQTVSLTSQGQISIPAKMRKKLNIKSPGKVRLSIDKDRLIIEPVVDILSLGGVFHKHAIKDKSIEEIMAIEKATIEGMYTAPHKKPK